MKLNWCQIKSRTSTRISNRRDIFFFMTKPSRWIIFLSINPIILNPSFAIFIPFYVFFLSFFFYFSLTFGGENNPVYPPCDPIAKARAGTRFNIGLWRLCFTVPLSLRFPPPFCPFDRPTFHPINPHSAFNLRVFASYSPPPHPPQVWGGCHGYAKRRTPNCGGVVDVPTTHRVPGERDDNNWRKHTERRPTNHSEYTDYQTWGSQTLKKRSSFKSLSLLRF